MITLPTPRSRTGDPASRGQPSRPTGTARDAVLARRPILSMVFDAVVTHEHVVRHREALR
jgi:hypothetical protein